MNQENSESPSSADGQSREPIPRNREVDKAAAALAEKSVLPIPPSKQLNWEQMQEYFALLTKEMWSHVMVYLYRLKPRIIRQLKDPDAPNYIDCVSEPFSMEYIINRHGGGKYMVECTDSARKKYGETAHLFRCYFVVDEVRYEPKLNYEELDVNNRENMSFIQMLQHRGVLDGKGHPVSNTQATAQPGAGGVNAEVIKEILGFVSKMSADQQENLRSRLSTDKDSIGKSVGDILLEQMKQNDPNKQTESMVKLISAIQAMYGQNKAADTTNVYAPFIQMLSEQNKTLVSLIEKVGKQRETEPPPHDDLDRLDKILNIAERLRGGGRRGPWDIGLDYAREVGVPLITTIGNLIGMRRGVGPIPMPAANPAAAVPNGAAPPMAAFDPYANPAATRAYASSLANQPAAGNNPIGTPPQPNPAPAGASNDLLVLLQSYSGMVLNALNNNVPGYDFADNIVRLLGAVPHAMISNYGEDAIVQSMLLLPEVAMFGEIRLRRFTNEFIHYQEILDEQERQEQEQEQRAEA